MRISLAKPRAEHRDQLLAIEDDLLTFFTAQPGYIDGYCLTSADQVGRMTVWDSEQTAEQAANAQHTLSVRSERLSLVETDSIDFGLEGIHFPKQ